MELTFDQFKKDADEFITKKNIAFKKNSVVHVKDIGRKGKHFFVREEWTFLQQSNYPNKVFVMERLRKESVDGELAYRDVWVKGDIEYRIGYFIVGKIGRTNGRWIWGQYCPMIPQIDFLQLLDKARKRGHF